MRTRIIAILVVGLAGVFAPACRGGDCELSATCAGPASSAGPSTDAGDDGDAAPIGYPLVEAPAGCVAESDPKDSPACVDNAYALFVDPTSGNDTNSGTRESPLHSLKAATNVDRLRGRPRIYVCAGTLDERVELPPDVSLVGGFECGSWKYVGAPFPIIAPSIAGIAAIHVLPATTLRITMSDIEVRGPPGDKDFASSIGIFISRTKTTLRRMTVKANTTVAPPEWASLPTNKFAGSLEGEGTASNTIVAPTKTCACPISGSSVGGAGGDLHSPGQDGTATPLGTATVAKGGDGGSTCNGGANGENGGFGTGGGGPGAAPGRIDPDRGWLGADGASGTPGLPGVGGGGGGGNTTIRGGGGACGGCGGNGGRGGRAGGSSIALVVYDSDVATFETSLSAESGSNAANGEHGETGADGGVGGGGGGCPGGLGGGGGGGGGGSGGTSGISAGIVRFGGNYSPDGKTTLKIKTNGSGGLLGTGGEGGAKSGTRAPSGGDGQAGSTIFDTHDIWVLTE